MKGGIFIPYVPVPKDLTTVKTKVAFNLTKRQLICFGLAAAVAVPTYFLTRGALGTTGAVMTLVIAALPFFFLAMYEKDGQPAEKILRNYIRSRFLTPRVRPYKTNNMYSAIMNQIKLDKEVKIMPKQNTNTRPKQKKKHIISANKPLSARQKKAIAAAIRKAQMQGRRAASAQQTIPYKEMYPDGICKVKDNYFTKTIQFFDINYQLARNEDKNEIFENYCDFLNYFDQSISVQFSFLNQTVDMAEYEKAVHIPEQADNFNDIRIEYMGYAQKSVVARKQRYYKAQIYHIRN